jgi:hypothetical protein
MDEWLIHRTPTSQAALQGDAVPSPEITDASVTIGCAAVRRPLQAEQT